MIADRPPRTEIIAPIIDAHAHFIDVTRPEGIVWPAPTAPFYGQRRVQEYAQAMKFLHVRGVVAVETSRRACDDAYLADLGRDHDEISGYVANLSPDTPAFEERLARYCADKKFKGVRLRPIDRYDLASRAVKDICDAVAQRGKVIALGTLDPKRLESFYALARAAPAARFVLAHAGHPLCKDGALNAGWIGAFRKEAAPANVWCLITTNFGRRLTNEASRAAVQQLPQILRALQSAFTLERLFWGSNWPITTPRQSALFLESMATALGAARFSRVMGRNALHIYDAGA